MIREIDVRCHLYGENFSPKLLEQLTGITLENKLEVGDMLTKGINRGKPSTYGDAILCPPDENKKSEDYGLLWVAETLYKNIDVIRNNVDHFELVIGVFYEEQCNFVLEPKALKLIGELGIPLQISCYESI